MQAERQQTETTLATLDLEQRQRTVLDLNDACAILEALPALSKSLAKADPELLRYIYEAFQFTVELDRKHPRGTNEGARIERFNAGKRPRFNRGHGRP